MSRNQDEELMGHLKRLLAGDTAGKNVRKLSQLLGLPSHARRQVRRLLQEMMREGQVVGMGRGYYALAEADDRVEGRLLRKGRHYMIRTEGPKGTEEFRVHTDDRGGALAGDRVRALRVRHRPRSIGEARVEEILERGGLPVVGVFHRQAKACFVRPDRDDDLGPILVIDSNPEARDGQVVALRLDDASPHGKLKGHIVRILGEPGDLACELERLKLEHDLPHDFPAAVNEALQVDELGDARTDLRHLPFLTIDPPDAKDFDDAVWVIAQESGFRLWVAIADVSAYVPMGGLVDEEAAVRGCSVYLPGQVVPMLPSALSEETCSLQPGQDRAAMILEMDFDGEGKRLAVRAQRGLIRSTARLSYGQVQAVLDGQVEPEQAGQAARFVEELKTMASLAKRLLAGLTERGQLEFNLPESNIRLDDEGQPVKVRPAEQRFANRLIESFMVAANEAVATCLGATEAPLAYRVHPEPDAEKIASFAAAAAELAHPVPFGEHPTPKQLQAFMASLAGKDAEPVLSSLLLRSLMRAHYSTENDGHFGLASDAYLHFTSPIRRYPDLMVHRQLGMVLAGAEQAVDLGRLDAKACNWPLSSEITSNLSELASLAERKALGAERAAVDLFHAAYMKERIGETYPAKVVFVAEFGLFVKAEPSGIEGLVPVRSLLDDYYHFDGDRMTLTGRSSGRRFGMGQELMVRVVDANLAARQVEYELL
ncbi:MAG: ribonuclease R [Deltaproteobacteria bacterium]|nr:ribonuclease R [Deltaproteobacteria bacterium]